MLFTNQPISLFATAILGLVLYFIGVETDVVYTLVIAAAVAMLVYRPRLSELEQLAKSHQ